MHKIAINEMLEPSCGDSKWPCGSSLSSTYCALALYHLERFTCTCIFVDNVS